MFDAKSIIKTALKGTECTKPVDIDVILAKGKTKPEIIALKQALESMTVSMEIMVCTITKKGKTSQKYWETPISVKAFMPYQPLRPHRATAHLL